MPRKPRPSHDSHPQALSGQLFTAAGVRRMLSDPGYAYGVNLLPAERVTEAVMKLNAQLAKQVRDNSVTFTLDDLDQRFQALLKQLQDSGVCHRGEDIPPIITKEQWLQAQLLTIQKLAQGEQL